jgi:release factor H-coupled RctB family protein
MLNPDLRLSSSIRFSALNPKVRMIASADNIVDFQVYEQLNHLAQQPEVDKVVAMPDIHPGKEGPVGVAVLTAGKRLPYLIGNDSGCGMAFWQTDIHTSELSPDILASKLQDLEAPCTIQQQAQTRKEFQIPSTDFDSDLGTIGGGNHFAEIQQLNHIEDTDEFNRLRLKPNQACLLVHSGSRGLGEDLYTSLKSSQQSLEDGTPQASTYTQQHHLANKWAKANRWLIAQRIFDQLKQQGQLISDNCHNSITAVNLNGTNTWLHRKGAAEANNGALMLAGSRGALSYLVKPINTALESLFSIAHGAGRKMKRSECRNGQNNKDELEQLKRTVFGSIVICDSPSLLQSEAPEAYKNIDQVVQDLQKANLIQVIASYKPLVTYKRRTKKISTESQ